MSDSTQQLSVFLCIHHAKHLFLIELENTAPRIQSDFKPEHADLVEAQKRKRLRKERRIKRIITVIVGYVVMAWMVYLILVTARTVTKLYDPYQILGVSRVRCVELRSQRGWQLLQSLRASAKPKQPHTDISLFIEFRRKSYFSPLQAPFSHLPPRQSPP